MSPRKLSMDQFEQRVADYKDRSKLWNYLGKTPALVVFYADWCPHCQVYAPVLEEVGESYGERLAVFKVNIDDQRRVAAVYNIRTIPTTCFFPLGGEHYVGEHYVRVGGMPTDALREMVDDILMK